MALRPFALGFLALTVVMVGSGSAASAGAPGGRIVYVRDVSASGPARYAIAEADLVRSRCRVLVQLPDVETFSLSPDGRAAAVVVATKAQLGELRLLTIATRRWRTIRRGVGRRPAVWSPDGRRLAYPARGYLRVIGADGRGDRAVTRANASAIAWSADGRRLAFAATTGNGRAGKLRTTLTVIGVDGRGRRSLFVDPAPYASRPVPAWSPVGDVIAFTSGEPSRIQVVSSSGGVVRTLGPGSDPRWSPDGSRISFAAGGPAGVSEVWTMAGDGTDKRRLTTSKPPPRGLPQVGSYPGPWAPDGSAISYVRNGVLATMGATGTAARVRCPLRPATSIHAAVWLRS